MHSVLIPHAAAIQYWLFPKPLRFLYNFTIVFMAESGACKQSTGKVSCTRKSFIFWIMAQIKDGITISPLFQHTINFLPNKKSGLEALWKKLFHKIHTPPPRKLMMDPLHYRYDIKTGPLVCLEHSYMYLLRSVKNSPYESSIAGGLEESSHWLELESTKAIIFDNNDRKKLILFWCAKYDVYWNIPGNKMFSFQKQSWWKKTLQGGR